MEKNVAGQKWRVFAFNSSTGAPKTGDAANITANLRKDWAAAAATNDTNPTEDEDGYYLFDLTQAETNADVLALAPESATANVVVLPLPPTYDTEDATTAGTVPAATGDELTDAIAARAATLAELAAMSSSKAGGLPNVIAKGNVDGVNSDHQGYVKTLLMKLKVLNEIIKDLTVEQSADAGNVGIIESEEWT